MLTHSEFMPTATTFEVEFPPKASSCSLALSSRVVEAFDRTTRKTARAARKRLAWQPTNTHTHNRDQMIHRTDLAIAMVSMWSRSKRQNIPQVHACYVIC